MVSMCEDKYYEVAGVLWVYVAYALTIYELPIIFSQLAVFNGTIFLMVAICNKLYSKNEMSESTPENGDEI